MFKKLTDFFKSLFGIHAWIHYKHISFSQWSIILSKKKLRMQNRPRGSNRWFINIFFDKWCFITEKDGSIIPDLQRTNTKKGTILRLYWFLVRYLPRSESKNGLVFMKNLAGYNRPWLLLAKMSTAS
jgi:hypothetical protein